MNRFSIILCFAALLCLTPGAKAQELLTPLQHSPMGVHRNAKSITVDTLTIELPFYDDFSNYEGLPRPALWLSGNAYVNTTYAPFPPTIGVATLDAVDADGQLYPGAGIGTFAGDTLASQYLRLDSLFTPYATALEPTDSVVFSFFYLPGGGSGNLWERIGDCPDAGDSLFVDFYDADADEWTTVWATDGGQPVDSINGAKPQLAWRFASIPVTDRRYFNKRFRFRFRNFCSLDANPKQGIVGNTDQWNIDCVWLASSRSLTDKTQRDVAFVNTPPSMLKDYQAMPARQFSASDMRSRTEVRIANRYRQALSSNYQYYVYDENGTVVAHYDGGYENVPPFYPNGTYQSVTDHATPPVNFAFPVNRRKQTFTVTHVVREGVVGDDCQANDTAVFRQQFGDYFAYDDGTPENGYGLTSTGNKMYLACLFNLNNADTLTAIDLYFNHTRNNENASIMFYLCLWSVGADGLPDTLIYRSPNKFRTSFCGFNRYCRYALPEAVLLPAGQVFVGLEQSGNSYINMGFDRNTDHRSKTYYRISSEWQQSILAGTLMMRPCVGSDALLGLPEAPSVSPRLSLTAYPNPANSVLRASLDGLDPLTTTLYLYDIHGRCLVQAPATAAISTAALPRGLYLLRAADSAKGRQAATRVAVIKH